MKNRLHVKAPGNWVNDPNGMIYYKGQYHLFYQHFPYAPRWGTMHWGHAVSPDLIHWEHVGVALFPSLSEDQNGCFSGSAVEENGVMHLFLVVSDKKSRKKKAFLIPPSFARLVLDFYDLLI